MNDLFERIRTLSEPPGLTKGHIEKVLGVALVLQHDNDYFDRFAATPEGTPFLRVNLQQPRSPKATQEWRMFMVLRPDAAPSLDDVENHYGVGAISDVLFRPTMPDIMVIFSYKLGATEVLFQHYGATKRLHTVVMVSRTPPL